MRFPEVITTQGPTIILSLASILLMTGCEQPGPTSTGTPAPQATAQPSVTPTSKPQAITLTLPILDALLGDENFVREVQTAMDLSAEDVQKLRDTSRNAVLNLSNDPTLDEQRSTRSSVAEARKQVGAILGQERTERFLSLAQQRWMNSDQQLGPDPNQVPTDTRVVVNAPAYRMDIFRDGQLVKSYTVGIGYPEFPLPVGLRKIKEVIFNPTWTPPDEPWVRGKVQPGKTVEAGSKLNPLGPIKIPIGLPSLIHGGKSRDRLGNFASHGCVGLTNEQIQDFAVQISSLAGSPFSLEDVKAHEKERTKTADVSLPQEVPVELRYETIVLENGVLKIYRDVYERGTNTEENLRKVLEHFGIAFDQLPEDLRSKILEGLDTMASDAAGRPVEPDTGNENTGNKNNDSGRVTRNVKGKKEVTFQIPNAGGKGYPAPTGPQPRAG